MGKYMKKAESRGVVKSDGKLSKQLAEQKKQNPLLADSSKDMPERIVVRFFKEKIRWETYMDYHETFTKVIQSFIISYCDLFC